MQSILLLTLFVLAVTAVPDNAQRIVGGSVTTINQYPFGAALLFSANLITYVQLCGGTIINNRSILSAAHCFVGHTANMWRVRVGSTFASSGGTVINIAAIIMHNYDIFTIDNDIAILRTASSIVYSNVVQPASIAGANYNLADNQAVWAMGWGATAWTGSFVEQLRHVQVWTVNQNECNTRYNGAITANMLCAGWLDVGDRGTCQGDSGGPLLHNNVVVGITSWGVGCGNAFFPGVNARVSQYTSWITANA